jgi:hypothetical protein
LWVLSKELASSESSGAQNFELILFLLRRSGATYIRSTTANQEFLFAFLQNKETNPHPTDSNNSAMLLTQAKRWSYHEKMFVL